MVVRRSAKATPVNFFGYGVSENAIPITPVEWERVGPLQHYPVERDRHAGFGVNMFANPEAAYNNIRQPILGYDTHDGGFGVYRGLPYWNVDLSVKKKFKITERFSTEFQVVFTNVFNHDQLGDPGGDYLDTSNPGGWGTLPGSVTNTAP